MMKRGYVFALAFLLATATLVAAASAERQAGLPSADPRFLARDLPLLPMGVERGMRPLFVVRSAYEFAARHPEVLNFVPCFCGCEQRGHKGSHDCFVTVRNSAGKVVAWEAHAIECEVCLDVAYKSMQMHNSGASVSAIRAAIEKQYAAAAHHTPTPMPKRGGGPHD